MKKYNCLTLNGVLDIEHQLAAAVSLPGDMCALPRPILVGQLHLCKSRRCRCTHSITRTLHLYAKSCMMFVWHTLLRKWSLPLVSNHAFINRKFFIGMKLVLESSKKVINERLHFVEFVELWAVFCRLGFIFCKMKKF